MNPSEQMFGEYGPAAIVVVKVLAAVGLVTVVGWTWREGKARGWLGVLGLWVVAGLGLGFWFAMGWIFGGSLGVAAAMMAGMAYLVLAAFGVQGTWYGVSAAWRRRRSQD